MSVFKRWQEPIGISEEQLEANMKDIDEISKKYQKILAGELTEEELLGKKQDEDNYGFSEFTCIEGGIR